MLSPASRLHGSPGEVVNVEFLLSNVGDGARYFAVSVNERSSGPAVVFPDQTFFSTLSEERPFLEPNETRTIVITMRIPQNAVYQTNKTFTLEVQPYGINAGGKEEFH